MILLQLFHTAIMNYVLPQNIHAEKITLKEIRIWFPFQMCVIFHAAYIIQVNISDLRKIVNGNSQTIRSSIRSD